MLNLIEMSESRNLNFVWGGWIALTLINFSVLIFVAPLVGFFDGNYFIQALIAYVFLMTFLSFYLMQSKKVALGCFVGFLVFPIPLIFLSLFFGI